MFPIFSIFCLHTANILTVLSTASGSVTCATVIWLYKLQPKIEIDLKLYSSVSLNVMYTNTAVVSRYTLFFSIFYFIALEESIIRS